MRTCPTCGDNTAEHGIAFRPNAPECMACEATREEISVVVRANFERRLAAALPPMLRWASKTLRIGAHRQISMKVAGGLGDVHVAAAWQRAVVPVSELLGVDPKRVLQGGRAFPEAAARFLVWLALRPVATSSAIARASGRDHATVLHGIKRAAALLNAPGEAGAQYRRAFMLAEAVIAETVAAS